MSVLVTGASGFIGRNLVKRLVADGREVVAVDVQPARYFEKVEAISWDIRRHEEIPSLAARFEGKVEACVHLAAVSTPKVVEQDPAVAWDINVRGTANALHLAREIRARKFVFASSAHVYGVNPSYVPTDEKHPLFLLDNYTVTKIMGEQLCDLYHRNHGLSTTTLRLFNAYGPGQSTEYFIGVKLRQALAGGPLTLMNAQVTKDWVWIEDLLDAVVKTLTTAYVGPINIGTGKETDLATIANHIATAFGAQVVGAPGTDNSPTRMCCDATLARRVLGWHATTSVAAGLDKLIQASRG